MVDHTRYAWYRATTHRCKVFKVEARSRMAGGWRGLSVTGLFELI